MKINAEELLLNNKQLATEEYVDNAILNTGGSEIKIIELPANSTNFEEPPKLPDGITYDDFNKDVIIHVTGPDFPNDVYISGSNMAIIPVDGEENPPLAKVFCWTMLNMLLALFVLEDNTYMLSNATLGFDSVDTYDKEQINSLLNEKADVTVTEDLYNQISDLSSVVNTKANSSDLNNYYTKSQTENLIATSGGGSGSTKVITITDPGDYDEHELPDGLTYDDFTDGTIIKLIWSLDDGDDSTNITAQLFYILKHEATLENADGSIGYKTFRTSNYINSNEYQTNYMGNIPTLSHVEQGPSIQIKLENGVCTFRKNTSSDTKDVNEYIISEFGNVYEAIGSKAEQSDVDTLKSKIKTIEITYKELITLIQNEKLIPGGKYILTDYSLKTNGVHTYVIKNEFVHTEAVAYATETSYSFKILLTAIQNNALSENVIILSNSLTYLGTDYETGYASYSQIAEAKYAVYNVNRFAWAEDLCDKGIIYWMKDRYGNEAPFDFYHITFKRTAQEIYKTCGYLPSSDQKLWLFTDYRNINNPKMFAPINFLRLSSGDNILLGVHDNIIKPRYEVYDSSYPSVCMMELPDIVFIETEEKIWGSKTSLPSDKYGFYGIFNNTIGGNSGHITMGSSCYNNSIGNNCVNVNIGSFSHSNVIGHYFQQNSIGFEFQSNSFGNHCQNNIILDRFKANNCQNELSDGQFGNDIKFNNFGNRSNALDLWDGCEYNSFAPFCKRVYLHGSCLSNTFNQDCFDITLNNECNGNMFAADTNNQTFTNIKNKFIGFNIYSETETSE